MRSALISFALLLSISLAGCAPQRQDIANADFRAEGKLAVRSSQGSESAQFVWQQAGERFDISVSGPAGLKAARLSGDDKAARFRQGDVDVSAASADDLAERLLGFAAPASSLRYWLTGELDPHYPADNIQRDAQGNLTSATQQQWQLEFSQYQQVNGQSLPGKLRASQRIGQITLVIKQWQWGKLSSGGAP